MNDKHIWRGKPSTEDEYSSEQVRQRGGGGHSVMGRTRCWVEMGKRPPSRQTILGCVDTWKVE